MNRKARRRATALFEDPKGEPGLRRKLLRQREVRARGKLDVLLRQVRRQLLEEKKGKTT